MSEVQYWMFVNGFLVLLDVEAVVLLGLHLWVRRKSFKLVHVVSLAFLIFLLGQVVFRAVYWELWHEIAMSNDIRSMTSRLMGLFRMPVIKVASLLNMAGLIMIVAVLTWNIRHLWMWATGIAAALAALSVWFAS